MISRDEALAMIGDIENYHIERTSSTDNMKKFCEDICAFSNDMPGSGKNGYLILGAHDNGKLSGLRVDDKLYKTITAIRSDGNILPFPSMSVEKFSFDEGDLLVVEVVPHPFPPVKFKGKTWIRIGPRKDIATEAEERALKERRQANLWSFETYPCKEATLDDLKLDLFKNIYLPA
ncbi:MAG: ATP-binding protein, partial [Alistipes sp.]|nr:ATP-binding protein [Alistipes sp.]